LLLFICCSLLEPENRAKAGISESLVRLAVGVEQVDILLEDLEQPLETV
jgi:cystathionine beta-lyase/cystathionine gamma-synthase